MTPWMGLGHPLPPMRKDRACQSEGWGVFSSGGRGSSNELCFLPPPHAVELSVRERGAAEWLAGCLSPSE